MSEFEIPIGSLEEQALKRKERLRNLKRKAETKDQTASTNTFNSDAEKVNLPLPTQLTKNVTDQPNEDAEHSQTALKNDDVISQITSEVHTLKTPIVIEEIDIQNLAPRKPDWDLKRDVAKKLEILDRRTQRAIAEIIRDRLRSNDGDVDLQAVNAVGYTAQPEN
ncbi:coiled-coil domain-containing protein 12 [Sitodiplosis mosellana]|uniref:coiled-coil domain-containing protein 12 n=1 Tax=Sitodiplosis mosellana TaxID=263140 RepID=UPI0024445918|nr:coiled-coil domain-containing protein 12 [Sitodiplosis mosellana]